MPEKSEESILQETALVPRVVKSGRIRQSLTFWCLNGTEWNWDIDRICTTAKELGCLSVELVAPELWATLCNYGLQCALAPNGMPDPPFRRGVNNTQYHDEVIETTKSMIERAADFGFPNVIAFTGFKWRNAEDPESEEIPLAEGFANSVNALSELSRYAAKKGVTICLEQLNTRDLTHPMKGHPGYQGDDLDYCAGIVRQVNSDHLKLLFDIYHVEIMNGDVVRRIRQYHPIIGHVHTAGNPGRGELDDRQEINYPAIMRTLREVGYQGYVGHEFIPVSDPLAGLIQAVELCDVA